MTTTTLAIDGIFVIFPVISITHNEKTHEKTEDRFDIAVVAEEVVGVNPLDGTSQQITDDVQSIVYFRPTSGMRPILSPAKAEDIRALVNEVRK